MNPRQLGGLYVVQVVKRFDVRSRDEQDRRECLAVHKRFFASRRQRSEQSRTPSQSRAHFFRQVKLRPQRAQALLGRSAFWRAFATRLRLGRSGRCLLSGQQVADFLQERDLERQLFRFALSLLAPKVLHGGCSPHHHKHGEGDDDKVDDGV